MPRAELTKPNNPKRCSSCPLNTGQSTFQVTTEYQGSPTKILFIGENPGAIEVDRKRPAIGPTGQILRRLVRMLNDGTEEGIAYGNIVRCRPVTKNGEDRAPSEQEVSCCRQFILRDIQRINPQYIVLLGNASTFGLATDPRTGNPASAEIGGVMRLRGLDYEVRTPNGNVYPAIITYNFAYVSRNPTYAGVWKEDIEKVFWRLRKDYPDFSARGKPTKIIDTIPKLKKLLHKLRYGLTKDDIVAFDYETTNISRLHPKVLCVGFSYAENTSYVVPVEHRETPWTGKELRKVKKLFRKFFSAREVSFGALVAHNLKFEAAVTQSYFGVRLCFMPTECTMLRAFSLNENRKALKGNALGLKNLVEEWMSFYHYHDPDIAPIVELRNKGELDKASLFALSQYCGMDSYAEWRLRKFQVYYAKMHKRSASFQKLSRVLLGPASVFAANLEIDGIRADKEQLRFLMSEKSPILRAMARIEEEMYALPSVKKTNRKLLKQTGGTSNMRSLWSSSEVARPWVFSLRSPKAKMMLFFDIMGLEPMSYTPKKSPQIDDKFYEAYMDRKEVALFSEWQDFEKLRSTYVDGIYKRLQNDPDMRDGRVRGRLMLSTAVTGRTSFEDPNMQNIPKGKTEEAKVIKRLYTAAPGRVMVCFDYSQAEVRWFAEVAKDKKLLREFHQVARIIDEMEENPTPENAIRRKVEGDFHVRTASQVFKVPPKEVSKKQRGVSKCVHPKTLVCTEGGVLTHIKNLCQFGKPDETIAVSDSAKVHAFDDTFVPVKASYNGGHKPLVVVVTRRGILTCSKEHRLLLKNGKLKRAGLIKPKDLLEPNDLPILEKDFEFPTIKVDLGYGLPLLDFTPTLEMAYFAGLYLGDGCKSVASPSCFICHGAVEKRDAHGIKYGKWQKILKRACKDAGFSKLTKHRTHLYIGGRHIASLLTALELIGKDNYRDLSIPSWILSAGKTAILHFLAGFFDTDGGVSDGAIAFTSKSPIFTGQICTALRYLGIRPMAEATWNKTYEKWYYRVRIPVEDSFQFADLMKHPGKLKRFHAPKIHHSYKEDNEVLHVIEYGDGPCVDIMVGSKNHLYATNGIITHNSIVFGNIYGMGLALLSATIKGTREEASKFQSMFFSQFPDGNKWLTDIEAFGLKNGFVESPLGRRRHLNGNYLLGTEPSKKPKFTKRDEDDKLGGLVAYEKRASRNSPIQGVASDTNLMACVALQKYIEENKKSWWIVNVVHDSIIADIPFDEVPEYIKVARSIMQSPKLFADFGYFPKVKFIVDCTIGINWGDQYDVTPVKTWEVSCSNLIEGEKCKGGDAFGKHRPKRCPVCNSKKIESELTGGPLPFLLNKLDKKHHLSGEDHA